MLKKIPVGIEDFKEIITKDYYYIDKTKLIEELLLEGSRVTLFTRPRRFGKTLNMSMLRYFFDIKNAENNKNLFKNLHIEKSPVFSEQGKYPVIFISMKGLTASTWKEVLKEISLKIKKLFKDYREIASSLDKYDILDFEKYILENDKLEEADLKKSLQYLTELLHNHYKEKVVLLIDEYDSPIITAYEKGFYNEMKDFLRAFYGDVLKTNEYLQMGVLTGIIRVVQAGIFSDLNNFESYTILNNQYSEYFGLLENEVENALLNYNIEYKLDEVKSWYDGYNFGTKEIYNPLSILKYLKTKELGAYWINTSGNILIKNLLILSSPKTFEDLDKLVKGEELLIYLNQSIALGENLTPNNLWELMLFSGYLTIKEKINDTTYLVKIPNKEVNSFFRNLFVEIVFRGKNSIADLKKALQSKDVKAIIEIIEEVVLNAMSFYDTDSRYENPYQTLLAGFFYGLDEYLMHPNVEAGYGRADIILEPLIKSWTGYIFELKRAKTTNIEKEVLEAYQQIDKNKYENLLKTVGIKDIVKIGVAFDKKIVKSYTI